MSQDIPVKVKEYFNEDIAKFILQLIDKHGLDKIKDNSSISNYLIDTQTIMGSDLNNVINEIKYQIKKDIYKTSFEKLIKTNKINKFNVYQISGKVEEIKLYELYPSYVKLNNHKYDYNDLKYMSNYWVDFANMNLGGGAFGKGFVQEEIMTLEFPEFLWYLYQANQNKKELKTRSYVRFDNNNVYSPIIISGLFRYLNINMYGWNDFNNTNLNLSEKLNLINPKSTTKILALAAQDLSGFREDNKIQLNDVKDYLYNLYYSFLLVSKIDNKNIMIHSGKLGCGAFKNKVLVCLLCHEFMCSIFNYDLQYYGITPNDKDMKNYNETKELIIDKFYKSKKNNGYITIDELSTIIFDVCKAKIGNFSQELNNDTTTAKYK